jgi:aminoglycoside 6'-N-acetyltransferase
MQEPHVAEWWRDAADPAALERAYGPAIDGDDPTEMFIVEVDGDPIGLIQGYENDDYPDWMRALSGTGLVERSVGLDYLIGPRDRIGVGLGTEMIGQFVADTWSRYPEISLIAVAVQQGNRRYWRALEKAGFERSWAGMLDSDDPSDSGPSFLYLLRRDVDADGP